MEKQIKEKTTKPIVNEHKETKYCTLLQSSKLNDEDTNSTYAIEKIFVKDMHREEIRFSIYRDMPDRSGRISNRILARPLDVTEKELIDLLQKAIKDKLFSNEFIKYLKNIVNEK